VGTKIALESLPPFTLIFGRFGLAAIFFALLMGRTGFPRFTRRDHVKVFLTALFEPGLYFIFETKGLQYTSAAKTALIIATIPLAVTILSRILLGERTTWASIGGIFLSLVGIAILITGDPSFAWDLSGPLYGDLLVVGAVLSAAFYMIIARNLGQRHTALEITTLQIFWGAAMFAPGFLWELPAIQWGAVSTGSFAALIYLTLFATIAAFICYNYALTQVIASRAAIFINCIPVVTAIGSWIILGELLTPVQMAGGALVIFAVCMANLPVFQRLSVRLEEALA
jgi:drug/metabolite transporter (DMT)-like permease